MTDRLTGGHANVHTTLSYQGDNNYPCPRPIKEVKITSLIFLKGKDNQCSLSFKE